MTVPNASCSKLKLPVCNRTYKLKNSKQKNQELELLLSNHKIGILDSKYQQSNNPRKIIDLFGYVF